VGGWSHSAVLVCGWAEWIGFFNMESGLLLTS
jgi:hypothetical protein